MASVSFYSQLTARNKAIGGLATGMDTDSLVEALTMATRSKLAKQMQQKTLLGWRQTAYRSVANTLTAFKTSNFSFSSGGGNLTAVGTFNVYKGTSSNEAVITAGKSSGMGSVSIKQVKQLASAASFKTEKFEKALVGEVPEGTRGYTAAELKEMDFIGKTMQLQLGGDTRTIKLDSLEELTGPPAEYIEKFTEELQRLADKAFGMNGVDGAGGSRVEMKNVAEPTAGGVKNAFKLQLVSDSEGLTVINNVDDFGLKQGQSNRMALSTTMEDLLGAENLKGDTFTISVNDTELTFNRKTTVSAFINAIDTSGAGVDANFNTRTQQFTFTSKIEGGGDSLRFADVEGNLLNQLVGAANGNTFTAGFSYNSVALEDELDFTAVRALALGSDGKMTTEKRENLANHSINLKVDGKDYALMLSISEAEMEKINKGEVSLEKALADSLNRQISAYEADEKGINAETGVEFKFEPDSEDQPNLAGKVTFSIARADKSITLGENILPKGQKGFALLFAGQTDAEGATLTSIGNKAVTMGYENEVSSETSFDIGAFFNTDTGGWDGDELKLDMTIDGVTKTLVIKLTDNEKESIATGNLKDQNGKKLEPGTEDYNKALAALLTSKLNSAKTAAYQAAGDKNAPASKVTFEVTGGGYIKLNSTSDQLAVSLSQTDGADAEEDFFQKVAGAIAGATDETAAGIAGSLRNFGQSGDADKNKSTTLGELGIGSGSLSITVGRGTLNADTETFSYTEAMTIEEFATKINEGLGRNIVKMENGKLVIDGGTQSIDFTDTPGAGATGVMETFFGTKDWVSMPAEEESANSKGNFIAGKNAVIVLADGEEITSSTNSFDIDGVLFTAKALYNTDEDGDPKGEADINISATYDTDTVVDRIKKFVDDYNSMVDAMTGLLKEKKVAGYEPLTDEQRAEMSEDQIKTWENEAKKGLLYNDKTIANVLQQMRSVLYERVEEAGISLYDIGITTESWNSANYKNNGRLEWGSDGTGEDKLRNMLETNPDAVRNLFASGSMEDPKGLAWRLNVVLDDAVRTTGTNQGSLVAIAGTEDLTSNNENTIKRQLENVEKQIALLQTRLENEYNRYWKQFSALETAVSNMNSQSSWLSSFGGGG